MRRLDAGALVVVVGLFALWAGLTDAALLYVRPSTGRWLVVAGAVLVAMGVTLLVRSRRRPAEDGHHAGRIGWLLAVPVAVAIAVGSNPLGSYAAGRQSAQRVLPAGEFDLEAHLRASSFGGQAAPLRVLDFVRAARDPDDRDLLAATPVRLTGFVTADEEGDGTTFFLTRFTIGCCAADALAVLVRVDLPDGDELPTPDEWIAVEGTLALEDPPTDGPATPRLTATRITPTDRPTEVYEYPP